MEFPQFKAGPWHGIWMISISALALSSGTIANAQAQKPERHFHIGISSNFESDANILHLADADPTQKRGDLHWAPTLTLDMERPFGRQDVYLIGAVGYNIYTHNRELNTTNANLQGGIDLRPVHICALRLGGAYVRQIASLSDVTTTTIGQNVQTATSTIARLNCERGYGLHPTFGFRHEAVRNEAANILANDTVSDNFDASLGLQRHYLGELSLYGNYRRGRYPHAVAGAAEVVLYYNAGLSYSRNIGARLRGSLAVGYNLVAPQLAGVLHYHGLSWSSDLTFTPGTRLIVRMGFSRDTQQSALTNASYAITTSAHAQADYALTPMLRLSVGAQTAAHVYIGNGQATPALGANDHAVSLNGGLSYSPTRTFLRGHVIYAANVTYSRRTADNPAFNTHDLVTALSIRIGV